MVLLLNSNHIIKDNTKSKIVIVKQKIFNILGFSPNLYELYEKIKNIPIKGIKIKADSNKYIKNKKKFFYYKINVIN